MYFLGPAGLGGEGRERAAAVLCCDALAWIGVDCQFCLYQGSPLRLAVVARGGGAVPPVSADLELKLSRVVVCGYHSACWKLHSLEFPSGLCSASLLSMAYGATPCSVALEAQASSSRLGRYGGSSSTSTRDSRLASSQVACSPVMAAAPSPTGLAGAVKKTRDWIVFL
jgi:hypothetical protein